ncbi:hypothetical protein GSI_12486 [Ganoderma sinense ZZ0214-1]|uniref:DUF6533 domain-containing protein n=1 Tax=Ganoderma sinense ZZ0214-1 TaxID=1077348 RepID=A0A2G8RSW6_9APHY|nr:hypothetical protein GSI_12486 [Ganoderma sinense ZZ0214-1]
MSSSQASEVAVYASIAIENHCGNAVGVLVAYDALITTADEIRCFWSRKITGAAVLFWLNKYLTIAFLVLSNTALCVLTIQTAFGFQVAVTLVWAAFGAMRVHALRKNRLLSLTVLVLFSVPGALNFSLNGGLELTGTIIDRSCVIVADCLVVGATWITLSPLYAPSKGGILKYTLSDVLLLDGTIYFIILAILNALHLTFTILATEVVALQAISYYAIFTTPVSAILVSRFLLHLQSANLRTMGQGSSQSLDIAVGSVIFERVMGSLGAQISREDYFRDEDLDEDHGGGDTDGCGESTGE